MIWAYTTNDGECQEAPDQGGLSVVFRLYAVHCFIRGISQNKHIRKCLDPNFSLWIEI
jgi:hypothetical protein